MNQQRCGTLSHTDNTYLCVRVCTCGTRSFLLSQASFVGEDLETYSMNQQRCGTLGRTDSTHLCGCVCMCGCGRDTIVQKITGFICGRGFGDSWHESAEMWCVCTCICGCDSGVLARFVLKACINYKQFYPTLYSSKNIQLVACYMWFDVCACVREYVCVYIKCDVFVCVCVCVYVCVHNVTPAIGQTCRQTRQACRSHPCTAARLQWLPLICHVQCATTHHLEH